MGPQIAIVGGGILGVMIAFELSRRGRVASVAILDRGLRGAGASLRSAGVHFPYGRSQITRALTRESQDFYRNTAPFDRAPAIRPVELHIGSSQPVETLQSHFIEPLRPVALHATLARILRGGRTTAVWACDSAHHADVHRLVQEISTGLPDEMVFHEGVAVSKIEDGHAGVTLRLSNGTHRRFDAVLLAPGPWSVGAPFSDLTAEIGLRVKRVVALHIPDPNLNEDAPMAFFPDADAFFLPLPDRRMWLFSYTNTAWDVDPDEVGPALSPSDLAQGEAILAELAPDLIGACRSGRVFCDTYTPERTPAIRSVGFSGRLIYAGGANGSGYRLAPAMAAEALRVLDDALKHGDLLTEAS